LSHRQARNGRSVELKRTIGTTILVTLVLAASGCGGGSDALKLSEAVEHAFAPAVHEEPATGSVLDNLKTAGTARDAGSALEELIHQENEYNEVMANALCAGMDELADESADTRASNDNWKDFLIGYFDKFGRSMVLHYAHADAVDRVNAFLGAWDMADVSPSYAANYAHACGLR